MSRSRWAKHDENDEAAEGELNLVPYLDIMMNLVIFLLFSFQVVIEVCKIDLVAPAYGLPGDQQAAQVPKAQVTVAVHKSGFTLLSDDPAMGVIDIPLVPARGQPQGVLDTERLRTELLNWKDNFAVSEGLVIIGDDDTEYTLIVLTMDALREYKGEPFFPDIMLARSTGAVVQR